jgi:hypothetical protein
MSCPSSMRPTYRSGSAGHVETGAVRLLSTWVIDRERRETAKRFVQSDGQPLLDGAPNAKPGTGSAPE